MVEWIMLQRNNKFGLMHLAKIFLQGGVGMGSYYYPIMMQFIFVFPLIFCIVKKWKEKGIIACFVINLIYELLQSSYDMNQECYRLLLFRYIFLISFGCFLALYEDNNKRWYILSIIVGIAFQYITQYTQYEPKIIKYWTGTSCVSALYIIPIFAYLFRNVDSDFCIRPINEIGKASFNVFLVQMVYYQTGANIIYSLIENWMIRVICNITICTILGYIFYMIEQPITKALTKKCLELAKTRY